MSDFNFKAGDKVYCPTTSSKIGEVATISSDNGEWYPVAVNIDSMTNWVTKDGKMYKDASIPAVFHATQENYEMLMKAFPNIQLEKPPKPKNPREIIQALLDDGWNIVPVIYRESEHECIGYANRTYATMTAIPYDPKSGKVIVDYVNGEVVLED